ncbi:hypothetical protein C1752_01299 [Acaryochloris thomasi RCC1774]|uniref:Uncharacterized protein n=1 Tax=Acaryochloris thomasi RCC1774 TaxID=1764569 RepID=A0A2W1JX55_9CYAN|nr:hypothetical protein [Acaryochloris thomasi]PZD74204.1 hypothetical protein C1752_01299 [Acaryochloris thomasi RCC1774]
MFKLSNLPLFTLLAVPLFPLSVGAQGFEPFPSPSTPSSSPPPASSAPSEPGQSPYFRSRAKNLARQAAERANGGLSQYRAESAMSGPALTAPFVENADGSLTFTFKGGPPGGAQTIETVATVVSSGAVNLDYNGPIRGSNVAAPPSAPSSNPSPGWTPAAPAPAPQPTAAPPVPQRPAPAPLQTLPSLPVAPAPSAPSAPRDDLPKLSPQSSRPQPVTIRPFEQELPTPSAPTTVASVPRPQSPQPQATTAVAPSAAADTALNADLFLARAKNLARQAAIQTNGGLGQYRPDPRMFGPASQAPHVKNTNGSITFKFRGGSPGAEAQLLESEITVAQDNKLTIDYNGPIRQ